MPAPEPLWSPSRERAEGSQMHAFMRRMAERHAVPGEWEGFRRWTIERSEVFWSELLEFAGIRPMVPAEAARSGQGMLGTRWFPGMRLNYAAHLLRFDDDEPAIFSECERDRHRRLTHRELRNETARCAAALREAGVIAGDRVAGYLPNFPETVIAMLAAASIGATWSSCSPDFGVSAVLDRFGQIEPKVLFVPDGYHYGGKRYELRSRVAEIVAGLPSVRRVVVAPWLNGPPRTEGIPRAIAWDDFLDPHGEATLEFAPLPFEHPLFIMFSSGTTGVPKCILHGHGGTLLQHAKEHLLHCDLRAGERFFYFTTCGWMMWNWLVSGLGSGAAIVLFDGNPTHPDADHLWRMAGELGLHVFGTSPKYLAMCRNLEMTPGRTHDLSNLRCVLSTGSPLTDDLFEWVYRNVKADVQLSSISGGTDIISCFMLGSPILPVYPGQIQCLGLGMDVQAWDENARPVISRRGELVCVNAFPSQPIGFWNDPDGAKYHSAYFDYYEHTEVWRHGDFIEITEQGGVIVYGRSDATLNPGGVRIGTAEIYRIVEQLPEVADSLVVGRPVADDVEVLLFVVLRDGATLSRELGEKIRRVIAEQATRRHVPRHIRQVDAIPYTVSGKKVEMAVQRVLMGEPVTNREALANPQALDQYAGIMDRRNGNGHGDNGHAVG